ncbi:tetratricopeptide (TPR) repeat protein [Microbacterium marinum]|uniref:Tetratricopeptide (TPR) repeat protein n=1 Tax=Microbacterium marinum TaxID=421115 RepID=A0A7W7BMP9_9MICO|nr:hypothetical protein [Microbacterium marinum]MBB4665492.1 tetratricopeptide (TPR) repeat protein [Microbacterium marinum]
MARPRPEWADYIVDSAHADTAALGATIAAEAQRSRRVQLEAARRQVEATQQQTVAIRETALAMQDAADRQVEAQYATAGVVAEVGASVDALADRVGDSLDLGFLRLQQTVDEGIATLDRNLDVLAGVMHGGFELVGQRMLEQTAVLGDIATMTANPLSTAAAEHYRRGVQSLQQRWLEEAIAELEQAVDKDRTNPAPHYALGVAKAASNEPADAFTALASAIKYSVADERWASLAASAAILLRSVAGPEQADEVARALDTALLVAPTCAELLLVRAAHLGSYDDLVAAFTLAPELALVAVQGGVPGAEEAAQSVHDDPAGPIRARREIQRIVASSGDPDFGSDAPPADVPQAMIGYPGWVRTVLPTIARHVRTGIPQRLEGAAAVASMTKAAADLGRITLAGAHDSLRGHERRRDEAAARVARNRAAVEAYRMLPPATATLEHEARASRGIRLFLRPLVALMLVILLTNVAGANTMVSVPAGIAAFVFAILLVVWLVKAFRALAEEREVVRREAATAQQIREHQVMLAQQQADRARDRAEGDLAAATATLTAMEQRVASEAARIAQLEAELDALDEEHRGASDAHAALVADTERFQRPILALLPSIERDRIRPLGDAL